MREYIVNLSTEHQKDIYNSKTKIVLFHDQEKLLEEVVFSLAFFMNAKTKNS